MKDKLMEKIDKILKVYGGWVHLGNVSQSKEVALEQLLSLLTSEVEKERERLLKEVDEKVIGDEDYTGKEFMGKFGVEMMGEDEAEHRNYLKKEQRKALSDIGGGK